MIIHLRNFLNELSSLHNYFAFPSYHETIREYREDFPILSKINTEDLDEFIDNISKLSDDMRYEKVFCNLDTLMDNCADLNASTLEFNKKISDAFEIAEKQQWISVEDRLPEPNSRILIVRDYTKYNRDRYVDKANVHYTEKSIPYGGPNSLTGSGWLKGIYFSVPAILAPGTVTHWMPLPELPKESEVSNE